MGWVQENGQWVKKPDARPRSNAVSSPNSPLRPTTGGPPDRAPPRIPLNTYTEMLREKPLELFRNFAVSPPNAAVGDEIVDALGSKVRNRAMQVASRSQIAMDGTFSRFFRSDMKSAGPEGFNHATVNKKIAWIKLEKDTTERHGALTFKAIIPSEKSKIPPGHIPVWFLPWESKHLIEMTIPPRQNEDDDDPDDPSIFFTAGINGCSVFVRGDPRSPSVTHAGISQGQTPYGNSPAAFWRDLLLAHLASDNQHGGRTAEINNTDYINQTGISGSAKTLNTDKYLTWLKSQPSGTATVSHVVPWGCVFGIRYGRLWSFYLQENAVVHTYTLIAKYATEQVTDTQKKFGILKKEVKKEVSTRKLVKKLSSVNKPVILRDFFPGKSGAVNFIDTWQKVF